MDTLDPMKSYRHVPYDTPYPYTTIPQQLKLFATRTPDKEAFIILSPAEKRKSLTCQEVYEKSVLFAKGLIKIGVRQGDVVAISLPNSPEWIISTFGTIIADAIATHFEFKKLDGSDVAEHFKNVGNVVALVFNAGNDDINLKICKNFYEELDASKRVKGTKIPSLANIICTSDLKEESSVQSLQEILDFGQDKIELPQLIPDDKCVIMYTSGSSGVPKAIYRTHLSLLTEGYKLSLLTEMTENDAFLHDRVLRWTVAFPNVYLYQSVTMVVFDRMFDKPSDTLQFTIHAMENEKVTAALLFPQCLQEFLKGGTAPCSRWPMKTLVTTGIPVAGMCSLILGKMATMFLPGYGNTELGAATAIPIRKEKDYKPFAVGRPLPGIEIKVVDDNGMTVPANQTGEIFVRHHLPFLGYINCPEKTNESYQTSGWFRMDDVGYMNEEGIFFVTGRKSDLMLIGGAKVSPSTTECAIVKHPDVEEVCVVPVADEINFQEQCACVVKRSGSNLDADILRQFLTKGSLPEEGFLKSVVPRYFIFLDKIPRTAVGKISRKDIIELAETMLKEK